MEVPAESEQPFASFMAFVRKYLLTGFVLTTFAVLVSPRSPWVAIAGLFIAFAWIYFVHRAVHLLPTSGPISYLNPHVFFHHDHDKSIDRRLELFMETINDTLMNLSLIPFQWLLGVQIVPTSVIVYHAITYVSVHIFNYSVVGSPTHRNHHKHMYTNYGPDPMDHIFGTSTYGVLEDLMPVTMNACFGALATLALNRYVIRLDGL